MIIATQSGIPVVAISGVKNSGKTTLLAHVIPLLKQKGLRVGVLKHDGHGFEPDREGTDSYRLSKAGSEVTVVFDSQRYMLVAQRPDTPVEDILEIFSGVDILLLEGFKNSAFQKIELIRSGVSRWPGLEHVIAICSDMHVEGESVPMFDLNDYEAIAEFLYLHTHMCK